MGLLLARAPHLQTASGPGNSRRQVGTPGRPTHTGLDQRGGASREDTGSCSGMALGAGVANVGESPALSPTGVLEAGCVACGVGDTPLSTPRPPSDLVFSLSDTEDGVPQKKGAAFPHPLPPKVVHVHGAHIQIPVIPAKLCVAPGAAQEAIWFLPGLR